MKRFNKFASIALASLVTTLYPIDLSDTAAVAGAIHFGQTKFELERTYALDGEWHFFWNEFIAPSGATPQAPRINLKVRGTWKNAQHPNGPLPVTGWGSYRLVMSLGQNRGDLALKIPNIGTSYKLFANGLQIAQVGIPSESANGAAARTLPVVAPLPLPDADGRILLIMHVSNYDDRHGGIWQTIRLGNRQKLENDLRNSYSLSTFLCGAILIIGLHHLLLFWRRLGEKANLAFGLLCILFAIRPLTEGSRYLLVMFPDFPWIVNSRLAYLTFYGALPLSSWFFRRVFPNQFHRWAHRIILIVTLPIISAVLLLPPRYYTETLAFIQLFSLVLILYSIVSIVRAIGANVRGARTLGIGVIFLFITAVLDILTVANVLNFPETASFGLVAFILSQSVLISLRDEDAHHRLEILAVENHDLISSMELKIVERTAMIAELSAEGDAVLNSLSDGVFLVNRDKIIGNKFSSQMFEILEVEPEALAGQPFASVIQQITGTKISEDATRFLKILYNPMIDDSSIKDLNPLDRLAVVGVKSKQEKIVHFDFSRQWKNRDIMAVFVSCRDITTTEAHRVEIEKRERQANRQLDIVRTLFSVSPEALQAFYGSIETELEDIHRELGPNGARDIRIRVETIYRAAHTIKGNAQLFNVDFLSAQVHEFETTLQELLNKNILENLDILSVNRAYSELEKSLNEFEDVILKIMKFQQAGGVHASAMDILRDSLPKMVAEISKKLNKEARIEFENFSSEFIPRAYGMAIRDAAVQSVRNALAHSIESSSERLALGKNRAGLISVSVHKTENTINISIKDDGKSFDLVAIRRRAAERNLAAPQIIEKMSDKEVLQFIFVPGFSTADPGGQVAGRGAGMDIVANKIKNLGGSVDIAWESGKFTEFTIVLPKK